MILPRPAAGRNPAAPVDARPGLAPGPIPGSRNLPFGGLFNADGTWKRGDELKAAFDAAGVDFDKPLVTTCGSGMTATVVAFVDQQAAPEPGAAQPVEPTGPEAEIPEYVMVEETA